MRVALAGAARRRSTRRSTHRAEALEYALAFGRGLDDARGDRFIEMYVNELTQDYGDEGREAVRELLARAEASGAYEAPVRVEFVE